MVELGALAVRVEELGEFGLIERIQRLVATSGAGVALGIGDDAAALQPAPGRLLLATCDSQVEGRHFLRGRITAEQLGRRLAAVNLSDIGAMGGEPRWALVSLVLPAGTETGFVEAFYRGLMDELGRYGAVIVGGNLSGGDELILDLTLLGEVAPERLLRRSGARAGDAILVTGALGAAAAGRAALDAGLDTAEARAAIAAHLTPRARVEAGQAIAASGLATSMADVSDGLARDLGHICDASGLDAEIEAAALPIAAGMREVARRLGMDVLRMALAGGEDYELVCTVPEASVAALTTTVEQHCDLSLTRAGRMLSAGEGRRLVFPDGRREPLGAWGWQHFAAT